MKFFRRVLSCILALVLVWCTLQLSVAAAQTYPVVFVTGYSSCRLYLDRGTENEERVWKPEVKDEALAAIKAEPLKFLLGASLGLSGKWDYLASTIGPYIDKMFEHMRMNDDGSSKYNVTVWPHAVKDTTFTAMSATHTVTDWDSMNAVAKAIGGNNVYCCTMDWRMSQVDCAASLDSYVDEVLALTGKNKVNLMGISFGGEVVSTYLSLYGGSKVNNVVLNVPAIGGTKTVTQLLSKQKLDVNYATLIGFYEAMEKSETDYTWVTRAIDAGFLDELIYKLIDGYLYDKMINFGSVWDLVPLEDYEYLKGKLLDPVKNAEIIRKSDILHYDVMAKLGETFARLRSEGVDISIVAGTGFDIVLGDPSNSDGVIDSAHATGARCAAYGSRLDNPTAQVCGNKSHRHISPALDIDASTAYLPENTWFVEGMLHGMSFSDPNAALLIVTLLTTEKISDVHSDDRYPQFMQGRCVSDGASFSFSGSDEGYITVYGGVMTVKNIFSDSSVSVTRVSCNGADLRFAFDANTVLAPGESAGITVYGRFPDDIKACTVTVEYAQYTEKLPIIRRRTLLFTCAPASVESSVLRADVDEAQKITAGGEPTVYNRDIKLFFARIADTLFRLMTR